VDGGWLFSTLDDLKSTGTRQEVSAIFLFSFARHERLVIGLATLFAHFVRTRRLFTEHFFVRWAFPATFRHANTNGFAGRLFFATSDGDEQGENKSPERTSAQKRLHGVAMKPDFTSVVNHSWFHPQEASTDT
jgi:hypothetical protein